MSSVMLGLSARLTGASLQCNSTGVAHRGGWALMQHQVLSSPGLALVDLTERPALVEPNQRGGNTLSNYLASSLGFYSCAQSKQPEMNHARHMQICVAMEEAKGAFHENTLPTLCPNKTQTCMGFDCSITTFALFLLFFSSPLALHFPRHFPPELLFHPHHTRWSVDFTTTTKQRHRDK